MVTTSFLFDGPDEVPLTLVLAHGAGAPMDSPFMESLARELAGRGVRVARFELPYTELYWNVPIEVKRGEPNEVKLTKENAKTRIKL